MFLGSTSTTELASCDWSILFLIDHVKSASEIFSSCCSTSYSIEQGPAKCHTGTMYGMVYAYSHTCSYSWHILIVDWYIKVIPSQLCITLSGLDPP